MVAPYIIDLDTVNGTFVNGQRIEGSRCGRARALAGAAAHHSGLPRRGGAAPRCGRRTPPGPHCPWRRYVELLERDVIKFGLSSREYVLLNDKSAG